MTKPIERCLQVSVLRAFTFWIRTELREECSAYLDGTKLKALAAAPGNQRATALFRDLGDGTTEVAVISVWDSMQSIRAFIEHESRRPLVDPHVRLKWFGHEPTMLHWTIPAPDAHPALPPRAG